MDKRIYEYLQVHPCSTVHDIANAIKEDELEVLKCVLTMQKKMYVKQDPPIPLGADNDKDCSCFYSVGSEPLV